MIGVPPMVGFISKWYLGIGAMNAGAHWVLAVLAASSLLNAAYFLPILHRAWFRPARGPWPAERHYPRAETDLWLLLPPVLTGVVVLAGGLLASLDYSPLEWARLVARQEFYRP
jgi:multicomponent Na+:H+ antiporter subunit D